MAKRERLKRTRDTDSDHGPVRSIGNLSAGRRLSTKSQLRVNVEVSIARKKAIVNQRYDHSSHHKFLGERRNE